MLAPITSIKHIVQVPIATVTMGNIANLNIADAKGVADGFTANEVTQGSVIKAVFVEIWILASSMNEGSFTVTLEKIGQGANDMTAVQGADLYNYTNKKNVLYTSQGLIGDQNTNAVPVIRQWIKIPKGKQRFGRNDRLEFNLLANVEGLEFCGLFIYKEYK